MSASETRSPATGNGEAKFRKQHTFSIVSENATPRHRWRPIAPPKKRLSMSAKLVAFICAMAQEGGRYE